MSKHKCAVWRPGCGLFRYAQAKLDGIWLEASWRPGLRLVTSLPTDLTARLVETQPWAKHMSHFIEREGALYGELVSPGHPASDVKSALKDGRRLDYVVFADTSLTVDATLEYVHQMTQSRYGVGFAPYIRTVYSDANCTHTDISAPAALHRLLGGEGIVFKNGNLLDWTKWKPVLTCDCVVMGVTEGEGKYMGLIGALRCGVYDADGQLKEIARVSGMDDATRCAFSLHEPIGQVVEVAYQYVGSQGRLRHPRYIRIRDDKTRQECTL